MNLERMTWIAFGACWLAVYFYCDFLTVWYGNIPEEMFESGYLDYEFGEYTKTGVMVALGGPVYGVIYFCFILIQRFLNKIKTGRLILLLLPLVVMGLVVLAIWWQQEYADPWGYDAYDSREYYNF